MESAQTSGEPPTAYTFAHLSDPHLTEPDAAHWSEMLNKRALGYLSWRRRQQAKASAAVLEQLRLELSALAPDHIAITGDLTNLGTPVEYKQAARWLTSLGDPDDVSVIPGNHDCYARDARVVPARLWQPWVGSSEGDLPGFPYVRYRGPVAFIGVSSACPTPVGFATGCLGPRQCRRLGELLDQAGSQGYCRVIIIHHPPQAEAVSRRKSLTDAALVRDVLGRHGAELVLHGHAHRFLAGSIPGPASRIAVFGAPAAASPGDSGPERGGYYLVALEATSAGTLVSVESRTLNAAADGFRRLDNFCSRLGPWPLVWGEPAA